MSPRDCIWELSAFFFVFWTKILNISKEGDGPGMVGAEAPSTVCSVPMPGPALSTGMAVGCSSLGTLSRCSFQSNICLSSCLQHAGVQEFAFPIRLFSEIREWGGELWPSTVPGLEGGVIFLM